MNKNYPKLKPNIQLFADPDGKAQPENVRAVQKGKDQHGT